MNTQDFLNRPVRQLFFHYLIPSIFATMVTSIYVLADTIIIGKGIGTVAVAALNIALPIYNIFFGIGLLFGVGGSVLMSICRGRGNTKQANAYFSLSLVLNIATWIICQILCIIFMEDLAWLLGGTEETMPYIMDYIFYIIWGMGAYFLSSYLQTFVRNDGAPKLAMNGVIAGGITNIVLDYLFVFPMNMGMAGAALATVIGSWLTVLILMLHFFSKKNTLKFSLKELKPVFFKNIVVNGFASFFIELSAGLTIVVFNLQLIKYVGNIGVTVYGIICNTALVVIGLCKGVNQASQPIISTNHGAGKKERIMEVFRLTQITSLTVCAIPIIIGLIFPNTFTYIFLNPDAEILSLSSSAIRIYFIGFIMMSVNMVFICYFQAIVKAAESLTVCLLRGFFLIIFFVFLLPVFFHVTGIWMAFPVTELLTMFEGIYLMKRTPTKKTL